MITLVPSPIQLASKQVTCLVVLHLVFPVDSYTHNRQGRGGKSTKFNESLHLIYTAVLLLSVVGIWNSWIVRKRASFLVPDAKSERQPDTHNQSISPAYYQTRGAS